MSSAKMIFDKCPRQFYHGEAYKSEWLLNYDKISFFSREHRHENFFPFWISLWPPPRLNKIVIFQINSFH